MSARGWRPALALLLAASPLAGQGTTRLLGRVVDVNGEPVRNVRLRIVGHGEPELFDSGEFQLQLSGRPSQVQVALLDPGLEVLYPSGGLIAVPADSSARVPVVVGKPERLYINDVLAARFVQLEATLKRNGVRYDASVDSLGEGVRRIISLLELREADLRSSIESARRQADLKPELFRVFDTYLLALKDLRNAFLLVVPYAATNIGAIKPLHDAIGGYNGAYEAVNNNRNAFLTRIRSDWAQARAEGLERDLADVYTEIIDEIHKPQVRPLAGSLAVIQLAHGRPRPTKQEIDQAVAAAKAAAAALEPRINVLEVKYARLREALERE